MKKEEQERRMGFARQEAATAWCGDKAKNKEMDADLAEEFAKILVKHMYAPKLGCATTGEMLEEIKTRIKMDGQLDYKTINEDCVKSTLEPEEETESLVPIDEARDKQILRKNKKTLEELEAGEASAMSKIAEDIEEEIKEDVLTDEEKTKKALDDADELIAREKEREKQKKKGWKLCTKCNSNRVAPWNKKKICSTCQNERKTERPYARHKEFKGL